MPLPKDFPPNNARDWPKIIAYFTSLPASPYASAMAQLVRHLDDSGFVSAGLRGTTSMFDLNLGLSSEVLNNPHVRISPATDAIELTYVDGSNSAWSVNVSYEDIVERVERFLIKRGRWFRKDSNPELA